MAQFGRTGTPTPTRTTSSNDELSYLNPKEMVIGGTIVSGTQFLDKDVLITISKLTKGDRITVPGDATSNAVKNLWGQGLFDDVKLNTSLSLQSFDKEDIKVFPNPANNYINVVSGNNSIIEDISIYNFIGQKIDSLQPNTAEKTVDISNYNSGIYIVKTSILGKTSATRIIKR